MQNEQTETLPAHMSIDYYDQYMHIQKKWFGIGTIILTVFLVIWISTFAALLAFADDELFDSIGGVTYILPLCFITMNGYMLYTCVALWLNVTDIFVSQDLMEVKIGPLPWRGNLRRETASIKQFYIKKRVIRSKSSTKINFDVHFKENDDSDHVLVKGFEKHEVALFIERKVEQYLGIKNINIDGQAEPED
ncbi:MAG: hypothetical protein COB13_007725 [OCS116 cluster bacterium]|nr:hypothetical protein [OCS116 cluster bacterium]